MYPVNEIFHSIQGEGRFMGTPATFIRLQGCPVGCSWCDTKDSWSKDGKKMSAEQISCEVRYPFVVITGGEPVMHNLDRLIRRLRLDHKCFLQLETCGAFLYKGIRRADFVTVSPKANVDFRVVIPPDELKFVVDDLLTEGVVRALMDRYPRTYIASFMPEGSPPTKESRKRAYDFATYTDWSIPTMYSDIQYVLGVK